MASTVFALPAHAQPPATKPAEGAQASRGVAAKPSALTGPTDPKKLLASAKEKRAAGDFPAALADYQAADALAPSPVTVEGIAFCHDKLGQFDDALTWYEAFVASAPPAMQAEASDAEARLKAIRSMPGHLHLESTPSNATVLVDGKEQPTHTPLDVDVPPGKHTLHLTAPGHDPVDKDIDVASRGNAALALELPETPPPPPPLPAPVVVAPPPPPPPRSIVPAIVTGSVAVVAAGIGVGFGIAALNDKSSFDAHPTTALANSGESAALVSDMGFGIAITLGLTSVILFATRNEQTTSASTPSGPMPSQAPKGSRVSPVTFAAAPFVTPHGGGAGATLHF